MNKRISTSSEDSGFAGQHVTDSFTIVSTGSDLHVVESFEASIETLRGRGLSVRHVGLASDSWYGGGAEKCYRSFGCEVHRWPRVSEDMAPWWQTSGQKQQASDSLPALRELVGKLVRKHKPDVFLLSDDTGRLEAELVRLFNRMRIPVVLLEHGYGFTFMQRDKLLVRAKCEVRRLIRELRTMSRSMLRSEVRVETGDASVISQDECSSPQPFGHNGACLICTLSELTGSILVKSGIDGAKVRNTGYPYFDKVVGMRERSALQCRGAKRILIVSSGASIFGRQKRSRTYFSFVLSVCEQLVEGYEVFIRLKPREEPASVLDAESLRRLRELGVRFDDNERRSYDALLDYELVLGEPSMVLHEALILNIPVVLLAPSPPPQTSQVHTGRLILEKVMRVLVLADVALSREVVEQALSGHYADEIRRRLAKNERFLYNGLDGKAGHRVGRVLLEAASSRLPPGPGSNQP